MEENETKQEFKVRDKRHFTKEGEAKQEEPGQKPAEEPKIESEARSEAQEPPKSSEKATPMPPVDFSSFVVTLANSALIQLGFIKLQEGESHKDLPGAKQTIDLISLLQEKTRGNLTTEEEKIITDVLFQLRMAFVEASK